MAPAIIDAWMQITTPRMAAEPWLASLLRWTGQGEASTDVPQTLAAMADLGGDG